jgi:hypothetical protein
MQNVNNTEPKKVFFFSSTTFYEFWLAQLFLSIVSFLAPSVSSSSLPSPKKVALLNKRHFEENNGECAACLKYSVLIFAKKI